MIFTFAFFLGMGPTMFIYCSDILDDFGMTIVGLINMASTWVFATFSNIGRF
jgi:hypothetical protein